MASVLAVQRCAQRGVVLRKVFRADLTAGFTEVLEKLPRQSALVEGVAALVLNGLKRLRKVG